MADANRQIVLRSRPKGAVHADNFETKSSVRMRRLGRSADVHKTDEKAVRRMLGI